MRCDYCPAKILERDDVECVFEPLVAEGALRRMRSLDDLMLMVVAEFDAETPIAAVLILWCASHHRNRYLPPLSVSTARGPRVSTARIYAKIM
jgi:hypothetical protein